MAVPHWAKVLGVAAALFIVCQGPFVYGWLRTPAGYRYIGGNLLGISDTPLYWWWMEQGRAGAWAVTSPFTTEPQLHGTFMPLWAGLGQLGRLSGIPSRTLYVAATLVGVWLALLVVDRLAKAAGFSRRRRLVAVLLAAGAGGFGWVGYVGWLLPWNLGLRNLFLHIGDAWATTMTLPGGASMSPHFPLLQALLALVMLLYLWKPQQRWLVLGTTTVAVATLGLLRPYDMVLVFCLYALLAASAWWLERPALGEHLARLVAVGVGAALPAAYFVWLTSVEPVFAWWVSRNVLPSANPLNYLLGWGLVAVLVVFGLAAVGWEGLKGRAWRLAALWVAAPLVLLYVPTLTQASAVDGWYIPVAVVAATGWREVMRYARRRWIIVAAIVILGLSTVARGALLTKWHSRNVVPVYGSSVFVEAFDWLRDRCLGRKVVILADSASVSFYLPWYTNCIQYVVVDRGIEYNFITLDYEVKSRLAKALFTNAPTSTSAERAWLADSGISYVFTVNTSPLVVPELELEWEREGVRIYRLTSGEYSD